MEGDGFKHVGRRQGCKAVQPASASSKDPQPQGGFRYRSSGAPHRPESKDSQLKKLQDRLEEIREVLHRQKIITASLSIFGGEYARFRAEEVVCYGIGGFLSSRIARIQLAYLLLLKSECKFENVFLFEPMLSDMEKTLLSSIYQIQILSQNEMGKRRISRPTLFFMPHCPKQLYSNVLWANWNANALSQIAIVGNSFSNYLLRNISAAKAKGKYIHRIEPFCSEVPLPTDFEFEAFNDTCIHLFDVDRLKGIGTEFWAEHEEESADPNDRELISAERCLLTLS